MASLSKLKPATKSARDGAYRCTKTLCMVTRPAPAPGKFTRFVPSPRVRAVLSGVGRMTPP